MRLSSVCLISILLLFTGCATAKSKQASTSEEQLKELLAADAAIEPLPHSGFPMEMNENVQEWLQYFSVKDRARFRTFLERGLRYKTIVKDILKDHGVPAELYYLAMIESGYVSHARSRARAVGPWQFMPSTARLYGLKANREVDERRDIIRSTKAAAKLLRNLHTEFGSWYLALAAYNAGPGRIRGAIRAGETNDFWVLATKRELPRETMDYVPKFLAAVMIGLNPGKYGFSDLKAEPFPKLQKARVPGSVHLRQISRWTGVSYEHLKEVNPHLLRQVTPRGVAYSIWVPQGQARPVRVEKLKTKKVKRTKPT